MKNCASFTSIIILYFLTGCYQSGIEGNRKISTSAYVFESFDTLQIDDVFHVNLYQADDHYVEIEAEENLLNLIDIAVVQNTLTIKFKEKINPHVPIKVDIAMPDLARVNITGTCSMKTMSPFITSQIIIDAEGASDINMDVIADQVYSYSKGAAKIRLSGTTGLLVNKMQGAGVFHGFKLDANEAKIDLQGVGKISLSVQEVLSASVDGVGKVEYIGSPTQLDKKISGMGKIVQIKN